MAELTVHAEPNGMTIQRHITRNSTILELTIKTRSGTETIQIFCAADAPHIRELPATASSAIDIDEPKNWLRMRVPIFMPQITDEDYFRISHDMENMVA